MAILEVRNLSKSFGSLKAVDNISIDVPEGSVFGLIGRNGAGKTTTIRMLMNIYLPDSGDIFIKGEKLSSEFKRKVGYLPEERGLFKKMKVAETLMFFAEIKGKTGQSVERKANEYLKKFELYDRRNSKIEDLSKGNQQKIQFITTILHDPEFLILDEPFTGLDPVNINILQEIIVSLRNEGRIIILSTHLMDYAEKMCDHLAMIDKGKIILQGSLSEIKSRFSQKNVSIIYEGNISFLENMPFVERVENFGNSAGVQVTDTRYIQDLLRTLVENNIVVKSFRANDISLQEIFIMTAGSEEEKEKKVYV